MVAGPFDMMAEVIDMVSQGRWELSDGVVP